MKIKAICRKDKTNKNGTSPLFIRFTDQRQSKFVSLGLSVEPCYWDFDAQMLTADCPDRRTLQSQIDGTLETYHKKIKRLEALEVDVNFDTLFETNGRKATVTVEDGFRAEIERLEALGKYSSAGKHRSALLALNAYHPAKIALEVIDIDYLKGFEMFLRKRGNGNNSIATRFAIFKAIYNKAVREGKFEPKKNPFTIYKVGAFGRLHAREPYRKRKFRVSPSWKSRTIINRLTNSWHGIYSSFPTSRRE